MRLMKEAARAISSKHCCVEGRVFWEAHFEGVINKTL